MMFKGGQAAHEHRTLILFLPHVSVIDCSSSLSLVEPHLRQLRLVSDVTGIRQGFVLLTHNDALKTSRRYSILLPTGFLIKMLLKLT